MACKNLFWLWELIFIPRVPKASILFMVSYLRTSFMYRRKYGSFSLRTGVIYVLRLPYYGPYLRVITRKYAWLALVTEVLHIMA